MGIYWLSPCIDHFGMTDSDQVGVVHKVPEDERKEWFLEAVSKMVDAFVYTRLKADLGKLISGVQQVINGTYSSSGRTARQPRQQLLVNPDVDVHVEPLTSISTPFFFTNSGSSGTPRIFCHRPCMFRS